MYKTITLIVLFLFSTIAYSKGTNVFGLGIYDIKLDGSENNQATDFRYEFRSDNSLLDIGPEEDNFFFLKPFLELNTQVTLLLIF
jgi:hypothetical protein